MSMDLAPFEAAKGVIARTATYDAGSSVLENAKAAKIAVLETEAAAYIRSYISDPSLMVTGLMYARLRVAAENMQIVDDELNAAGNAGNFNACKPRLRNSGVAAGDAGTAMTSRTLDVYIQGYSSMLAWMAGVWIDCFGRSDTVSAAGSVSAVDAVSIDYSNNSSPPYSFREAVQALSNIGAYP